MGVHLSTQGVAVAHVEQGGAPSLTATTFLAGANAVDQLQAYVREHNLAGAELNLVLSQPDYSLLLVEPPQVAADELKQALRWRIKDMVEFDVGTAAIDIVELPAGTYPNREMIYVVAAAQAKIAEAEAVAERLELKLKTLDVAEITLANLGQRLLAKESTAAVLYLQPGDSTVNVFKNGLLYMTRAINDGLSWSDDQSLAADCDVERLLLEVQRSLDYYESQLRQTPVSQLYLLPGVGAGGEALCERFNTDLGLKTEVMAFHEVVSGVKHDAGIVDKLAPQCLLAIAGALRNCHDEASAERMAS